MDGCHPLPHIKGVTSFLVRKPDSDEAHFQQFQWQLTLGVTSPSFCSLQARVDRLARRQLSNFWLFDLLPVQQKVSQRLRYVEGDPPQAEESGRFA